MITKPLDILYEDEFIFVCKKPAGVPTQTKSLRTPDMETQIKQHIYMSSSIKKEPYLGVIHRLDQPVSGLLVFAKTPAAAKSLNQQIQSKGPTGFQKYYTALLTQEPPLTLSGQPLINYMKKDGKTNTSSICSSKDKDGKKAILTYEIIKNPTSNLWNLFSHCQIPNPELTTPVSILLETGRHHQIRVQMAHLGCPIWGDTKYGSSNTQWEYISLCASTLKFLHPHTKKPLQFTLLDS